MRKIRKAGLVKKKGGNAIPILGGLRMNYALIQAIDKLSKQPIEQQPEDK